jgi:3-hydroxyisobutyrate dehydrogenase
MKTGFIGLGAMGAPMALNLKRAGVLVAVWNRTRERGDQFAADHDVPLAEDVADLARRCEVLVSCVSDDAALEEVVAQAVPGLQAGSVWVDTSTVSVATVRALADRLASRETAFLDAPVSGGVEGARKGSLVMMAGGDEPVLERVRPVLQVLARRIEFFGRVGSGQAAKAVNQLMAAGINQAVSEALAFGEALGLPMERVAALLAEGAAGSWMLQHRGASMVRGDYAPGFRLALHEKDLQLCRQLADEFQVHLPLVEMTLVHYRRLQQAGHGDEDISALIREKRKLFEPS